MKLALFLVLPLCAVSQDFSTVHIERVSGNHKFTEGPVWSPEGVLLFSDVPSDAIQKFVPNKGTEIFRKPSHGANGNTFDDKGRLLTCESFSRRVTRTDKKGNIEVLAEKYQGKRLNAPNDIVVRRDGHIYFTDPAFGNQADARELDFYGVYHITTKGELALLAQPRGRPNGIALSPNGRILYVANSDERNVRAYDLDRQGAASNERVLISKIDGVPDGMKVDEKGNLYLTARGLAVYSPQGNLIHTLEFGETPANCAWGESDLSAMYVTARTSVYRIYKMPVKGSVQYERQP